MHRADAEQRRHRRALGAQVAVGEDDDVHAARHELRGLAGTSPRCAAPCPAAPSSTGQVMSIVRASKTLWSTCRSFSSSRVAQDRLRHHELVAVVGRLAEQVDLRADAGLEAHHDRLADRVDGRVGDLGEQLLEVGEQRRARVGHRGERHVVAHRAGGLGGRRAPSARGSPAGPPRSSRRRAAWRAAAPRAARAGSSRAGPRCAPRGRAATRRRAGGAARSRLISSSGTIRSRSRSTRKSLPGRSRPLADDLVLARPRARPVSEASTTQPSLGHQPAAGAQAVAVERRADHAAVGEGHGRRAVPRLDRATSGRRRSRARPAAARAGPGRPRGSASRSRARASGRRARAAPAARRARRSPRCRRAAAADLLHVVAEQRRGERQLARAHPVAVAAQRVDLAVVGEHPVGVGQLPAREGVGREARVDEREAATRSAVVLEVGEVARELGRGEHPLVDDRARGEARDREARRASRARPRGGSRRACARARPGRLDSVAGAHEELGDVRARPRWRPCRRRGRRPARRASRARAGPRPRPCARSARSALGARRRVLRAGSTWPRRSRPAAGSSKPASARRNSVGELEQDARAVARVGVGALGAAVLEVLERPQRARDHLVRGGRAEARDERDAAGVVLVARVVQAVRCLQGGASPPRGSAPSPSGRAAGAEREIMTVSFRPALG